MSPLRTEFPFVLPKGLLGADGTLDRLGSMRLATARDELDAIRDPSLTGDDDPRLGLLILARVVTRLGDRSQLSVDELESLYAADLAELHEVYRVVNYGTTEELHAHLDNVRAGHPSAPAPLELAPDDEAAPALDPPAPAAPITPATPTTGAVQPATATPEAAPDRPTTGHSNDEARADDELTADGQATVSTSRAAAATQAAAQPDASARDARGDHPAAASRSARSNPSHEPSRDPGRSSTPVSDAARALLATPVPIPDHREQPTDQHARSTDEPDGAPSAGAATVGSSDPIPSPTPPAEPALAPASTPPGGSRRSRIEEVGRSNGRPRGV